MTTFAERCVDRGWLPDWLVRLGIRRLLRARLREEHAHDPERAAERLRQWIARCDASPIAVETRAANAQHYEVPAAFFARVLGRHCKYSSGLWTNANTLDDAEAAMLALSCERAEISDGQRVLDLGCGWGSLSLWIARTFPRCRVTGVSNSASQREDVLARARAEGLRGLEIVTADVNSFAPHGTFDRIVSVEMMEHTRNWRRLLERAAGWLVPGGKMFVHVFTHATVGYEFAAGGQGSGSGDWLARHFFTGGQMPADAQLLHFQDHFAVEAHWRVSGTHYARTAEAWLARFDAARTELAPVLAQVHGDDAEVMANRWRVFFLACAELWGFAGGREWFVSHYRLRRRS